MDLQIVIVIILFAVALAYIGRMIWRSIQPQKGCGSNCKCGVDFSSVETGRKP